MQIYKQLSILLWTLGLTTIALVESVGNGTGQWGAWSRWKCNVTCRDKGMLIRERQCNNPSPQGHGQMCKGRHFLEGKACDKTSVPCPNECRPGKWNVGCVDSCPDNCIGQDCDKVHGYCAGCQPGFNGDRCETICPEWNFGLNCSEECTAYCSNNCGTTVDGCYEDSAEIIILVLVFTSLSFLPTVLTCCYFLANYRKANFKALMQIPDHELIGLTLMTSDTASATPARRDDKASDDTDEDFVFFK